MKILILPIVLFLISNFSLAQGSYSIQKKYINTRADSTTLYIKFIAPDGSPAKHSTQITINGDTLNPQVDSTGRSQIQLPDGTYKVHAINEWCYVIETDSIEIDGQSQIHITFHLDPKEIVIPEIHYDFDKPVIYLYPDSAMNISVQVDFDGEFKFTYPSYCDSWQVTAYPGGKIIHDGNEYNYLFWDGSIRAHTDDIDWSTGFIVNTDTLVTFLERKLTFTGFNPGETQDFITYWVPQMKVHETVYLHFIFNPDYDHFVNLTIDPQPQTLIRLFMFWQPDSLNSHTRITPQKFPGYKRNGFTVVDWGGSKVSNSLIVFADPP